jgi:predicted  nucleic acid-binding Zn-ribbon protein
MKKQVIYTMPYNTESEIKKVNAKRQRLYEKFNSVQVCPNGLYEVRIICEN